MNLNSAQRQPHIRQRFSSQNNDSIKCQVTHVLMAVEIERLHKLLKKNDEETKKIRRLLIDQELIICDYKEYIQEFTSTVWREVQEHFEALKKLTDKTDDTSMKHELQQMLYRQDALEKMQLEMSERHQALRAQQQASRLGTDGEDQINFTDQNQIFKKKLEEKTNEIKKLRNTLNTRDKEVTDQLVKLREKDQIINYLQKSKMEDSKKVVISSLDQFPSDTSLGNLRQQTRTTGIHQSKAELLEDKIKELFGEVDIREKFLDKILHILGSKESLVTEHQDSDKAQEAEHRGIQKETEFQVLIDRALSLLKQILQPEHKQLYETHRVIIDVFRDYCLLHTIVSAQREENKWKEIISFLENLLGIQGTQEIQIKQEQKIEEQQKSQIYTQTLNPQQRYRTPISKRIVQTVPSPRMNYQLQAPPQQQQLFNQSMGISTQSVRIYKSPAKDRQIVTNIQLIDHFDTLIQQLVDTENNLKLAYNVELVHAQIAILTELLKMKWQLIGPEEVIEQPSIYQQPQVYNQAIQQEYVETLRQEIRQLKSRIQQFEDQNVIFQDYQRRLSIYEQENQRLQLTIQQLKQYQVEVEKLRSEKSQLELQFLNLDRDRQSRLSVESKEHDTLLNQLTDYQIRFMKLEEEYHLIKSKYDSEVGQFNTRSQYLEKYVTDLQQALAQRDTIIQRQQQDISQSNMIKEENVRLRSQIELLIQQIDAFKSSATLQQQSIIDSYLPEIKKVTEQLNELQIQYATQQQEYENKLSQVRRQYEEQIALVSNQKMQLQEQKNIIIQQQQEITVLRSKSDQNQQDLNLRFSQFKQTKQLLEKENQSLSVKVQELQTKLSQLNRFEQLYLETRQKKLEAESQVENLRTQIQKDEETIKELKNRYDNLEKESYIKIDQDKADQFRIQQEVIKLQDKKAGQIKFIKQLQQNIAELKEQILKLNQDLQNQQSQIDFYSLNTPQLKSQIEELLNQNKNLVIVNEQLASENERFSKDMSKMKLASDSRYNKDLFEWKQKYANLQQKYDDLNNSQQNLISEKNQLLNEWQQKFTQLQFQFNDLMHENNNLNTSYSKIQSEFNQQLSQLYLLQQENSEIPNFKKTINDYASTIQKLQIKVQEQENRLIEQENKFKIEKGYMEKTLDQKSNSLSQLDVEISQLKLDLEKTRFGLQQKDFEINDFKMKVDLLEKQIITLQDQLKRFDEEKNKLYGESLRDSKEIDKYRLQEMQWQQDRINLQLLQNQFDSLKQTEKLWQNEEKNLRQQNLDKDLALTNLQFRIDDLQRINDDLRRQLSGFEQQGIIQITKLNQQIDNLSRENNELRLQQSNLTQQITISQISIRNEYEQLIEGDELKIKDLTNENRRLNDQISENDLKIKLLKDKIDNLNNQLQQKNVEMQSLNDQINIINERHKSLLSSLNEQLDVQHKKVGDRENEIRRLQEEIIELKQKHQAILDAERRGWDYQVQQLQSKIQDQNPIIIEQIVEREVIVQDVTQLQNYEQQYSDLQRSFDSNVSQIKKLQMEKSQLQDQIDQLQILLEDTQRQNDYWKTEIQRWTQQQQQYQEGSVNQNQLRSQIEFLQKDVEFLSDKNQILQRENDQMTSRINQLLDDQANNQVQILAQQQDFQNQSGKWFTQQKELNDKLVSREKEIDKLKNELKIQEQQSRSKDQELMELENMIRNFKVSNDSQLVKLNELEIMKQDLEQTLQKMQIDRSRLEEDIIGYKTEIQVLQDNNEELNRKHLNVSEELSETKKKLDKLIKESDKVRRENNDLRKRINELQNQIATNQIAIRSEVEQLIEKDHTKIKELLDQNRDLKQQLQDVQLEMNRLQNQNQALNLETNNLNITKQDLQQQLHENQQRINVLVEENNLLQNQLDQKTMQITNLNGEINQLNEKSKQLMNNLNTQLDDLHKRIGEKENEILYLQEEMIDLKQSQQEQLDALRNGWEYQIQQLESKLQDQTPIIIEQIVEKNVLVQDLSQVDHYERQINELKQTIESKQHQIQSLQSSNSELQEQLNQIQILLQDAVRQNEYWKVENQKWSQQQQQLQEEISNQNQQSLIERQTLEDKYREIQKVLENKQKQIHELLTINSNQIQQIQELKNSILDLERQLDYWQKQSQQILQYQSQEIVDLQQEQQLDNQLKNELNVVKQERDQLQDNLQHLQIELSQLMTTRDRKSTGTQSILNDVQLGSLEESQLRPSVLQAQLNHWKRKYEELEQMLRNQPQYDSEDMRNLQSVINDQQKQIQDLKNQLNESSAQQESDNVLQQELQNLKNLHDDYLKQLRESTYQLQEKTQQQRKQQELVEQLKQQIQDLQKGDPDIMLKEEIQNLRKLHNQYLDELSELTKQLQEKNKSEQQNQMFVKALQQQIESLQLILQVDKQKSEEGQMLDQKQTQEFQDKIKSLEEDLNYWKSRCLKQRERGLSSSQFEGQQVKIMSLQNQILILRNRVVDLESDLEKRKQYEQTLKDQITEISVVNDQQKNQIIDLKNQLQRSIQDEQKLTDQLNRQLESFNISNQDYQQRINYLEKELQNYRRSSQLRDSQSRSMSRSDNLDVEVLKNQLSQTKQNYQVQINDLQQQITWLNQQLQLEKEKIQNDWIEKIKQLENQRLSEIQLLKEQIQQLRSNSLNFQEIERSGEILLTQMELQEFKRKYQDLYLVYQRLINDFETQNKQLQIQILLNEQGTELRAINMELNERLIKIESDNIQLQILVEQLEKTIENLQEKLVKSHNLLDQRKSEAQRLLQVLENMSQTQSKLTSVDYLQEILQQRPREPEQEELKKIIKELNDVKFRYQEALQHLFQLEQQLTEKLMTDQIIIE